MRAARAFVAGLHLLQPAHQLCGPEPCPGQDFTYHPIHLRARDVGNLFPPCLLQAQQKGSGQQAHDRVSDAEANARGAFDLGWKVALGLDAYVRPFAQGTLQCFRAQLILHEKMRTGFVSSLDLPREWGLRAVLNTTPMLGHRAAKDTYNLLVDGIRQLMRRLAAVQKREVAAWAGPEG